jgi:hypothetical protein
MLEAMAYPTWVRSSPSIFAYTMINSLHAIGLAILVGTHTVVCLRLLGALKELPLAKVRKLYPIMYTGMWINIFSGLSLFWASLSELLVNPAYYTKMAFVIVGITLMVRMRRRVFSDTALAVNPEPTAEARGLAWLSLACWVGGIISGRLTAYPGMLSQTFGF